MERTIIKKLKLTGSVLCLLWPFAITVGIILAATKHPLWGLLALAWFIGIVVNEATSPGGID